MGGGGGAATQVATLAEISGFSHAFFFTIHASAAAAAVPCCPALWKSGCGYRRGRRRLGSNQWYRRWVARRGGSRRPQPLFFLSFFGLFLGFLAAGFLAGVLAGAAGVGAAAATVTLSC